MSKYCSHGRDGFKILKKCVSNELLELIKSDLTIVVPGIYKHLPPKIFKTYKSDSKYYYLPLFWALKNISIKPVNVYDNIFSNNSSTVDCNFRFNSLLYMYQIPMFNNVIEHYIDFNTCLFRDHGSCILNIDTGLGKTMMAMSIASFISQPVIIVTHTNGIAELWEREIKKHIIGSNVQIFTSGTKIKPETNVLITKVQTLIKRDYSEIYRKFNFAIFDELHHYGSAEFSKVLLEINTPYKLGMTATLERRDGNEKVLRNFLGPIGHKHIEALDQFVRIQVYRFECLNPLFREIKYGENIQFSKMLNNFAEIHERNMLICGIVNKVLTLEPSRQVLVICHRLKQIDSLQLILESFPQFKCGTKVGQYVGKEEMKRRGLDVKVAEKKQVILGGYNVMQEGVNIRTLDTVIIASAQKGIVQSCGRIFRKLKEEYENEPTIIDIADQIGVYIGMERARLRQYREKYMKYGTNTIKYYNYSHKTGFKIEFSHELSGKDITAEVEPKVQRVNINSIFDDE